MVTEIRLYQYLQLAALIIYVSLSYYFFLKYKENRINVSLFWLLTYVMFALSSIIAFILTFTTGDITVIERVRVPFVFGGIGFLGTSVLSTGVVPGNQRFLEILGLISMILIFVLTSFEPPLFLLGLLIFYIHAILIIGGYGFLSIRGRNLRLGLVAIFFLLTGIIGTFSDEVTLLIGNLSKVGLRVLIDVGVAISLMGFKGRKTEE